MKRDLPLGDPDYLDEIDAHFARKESASAHALWLQSITGRFFARSDKNPTRRTANFPWRLAGRCLAVLDHHGEFPVTAQIEESHVSQIHLQIPLLGI